MQNSFKRTTGCGLITEQLLNSTVTLAGWVQKRRDLGNLIFIDLRDRSGVMQLVFNPDCGPELHRKAHELRSEYVIGVTGKVVKRTQGMANPDMPTGNFELQVEDVIIFNTAKTLPFELNRLQDVSEDLKLKYRYLELRNPELQKKFKLRSSVNNAIREFFTEHDFYEVETPYLTKSTPEGARDFVVPSRIKKGSFYALAQSPQLYKELLMAAGFEKYFQIARCFRDEGLRADRQPEFTQLDIEMSFVNEQDIQELMEKLYVHIWKKVLDKDLKTPFERLTYDQAFNMYGNDKPDTRFDLKIKECTELFENSELSFLQSVLKKGGKIGALHITGHNFSRKEFDLLEQQAKEYGAQGLLRIHFENKKAISPVAKFLPDDFFAQAQKLFPDLADDSTLLMIAGDYTTSWEHLGRLRLYCANMLNLIPKDTFNFLWVTDFPMFEWSEEDKRWVAKHHPFTQPQEGWEKQEPSEIKARAYDLVLNGYEIGSGSIRIHKEEMQQKIFEHLGISAKEADEKFGFLLEAQEFGFPPLGGIAFGMDRLAMIMSQGQSLREVIAFPKTTSGTDLMMNAPASVSEKQLDEYGLELKKKKD